MTTGVDTMIPHRVTVGNFELFVAHGFLQQWGHRHAYSLVAFHTDSELAAHWVESGFASNAMAQEQCRVICALECALKLRLV